MSVLSDWTERFKALVRGRRQEDDLDDEVRFHVERETEERVRRGADPAAARREALIAFGGIERFKEEVRDARGIRPFQEFLADARYALRGLRASPIFATAAITVLGLALGASTVVFTLADRVLFADLPYPAADRLIRVYQQNSPTNRWSLSAVDVLAIREQQRTMDAFGIVSRGAASFAGAGRPERVTAGWATADFFRVLGVRVAAGRLATARDEADDAPGVAVLTDAMARERFGGPAAAVGRAITVDGVDHTIVGVLPPGLEDLAAIPAQVWIPLKLKVPTRRGPFWLRGIGRLKPGLTIDDASRDLAGISERIFPAWASSFRDQTARLIPVPLRDAVVGQAGRQLGLFAGAVLLVLLVALANVATLMLVRASAREQELALRAALGAGKARLACLLVADSLVLTVVAGLAGLGIAAVGLRLIAAHVTGLPRIDEVVLGSRSLVFAVALSVVAGFLVSAPALIASLAGKGHGSLRLDTRRAGTGRRTNLVRNALVVAEFAMALPLLVGAGLLIRSFVALQGVNPGFDPAGAVSIAVALPDVRYPNDSVTARFWDLLEQRAAALPGVTAAGYTINLPPAEPEITNNFNLIDRPVPEGGAEPTAPWSAVSAGYLRALGVPLLAGRSFTVGDSAAAPPVVLVSRSWERRFYPGGSALGKRMVSGGCYTCPPTTVVGVVGDVKYLGLAGDAIGVYSPLPQFLLRYLNLVVRTTAGEAATLRELRAVVAGLDPDLPVVETTMRTALDRSLADPFRWTAVLSAFGAAAMALAALGVFGLMSYAVRQRRREIGIRLALGAAPGAVTAMVVRRGLGYALGGSAIGMVLTLLGGRWLGGFLYGVGAADPATVAGVSALLIATAALACWLPGHQAGRIPPIEAIGGDG